MPERRSDPWSWAVVEAGLQVLQDEGEEAAIHYMTIYHIPQDVIDRVIHHPEMRRHPCVLDDPSILDT